MSGVHSVHAVHHVHESVTRARTREGSSPWQLSDRADPLTCAIADQHYSRQAIGSRQCAPPGRAIVLRVGQDEAYWITSWALPEFVKHRWPGAWTCTAFRRESFSPHRASDLIKSAIAVTRWLAERTPSWQRMPLSSLGMLTFVDPAQVADKELPGWCFLRAGFKYLPDLAEPDGRARTKEKGYLALWLPRRRFPEPIPPAQWSLNQ